MLSNLNPSKTKIISSALLLLRTIIGWHFLYEGLSKLFMGSWSAYGYLTGSDWFLANFFQWIAETPKVLAVVDVLNIWGLILIGIALILGLFTRVAAISGVALLSLYYLANSPLSGIDPSGGHVLFVNKTLIELTTLAIFMIIPSERIIGIDRLLNLMSQNKKRKEKAASETQPLLQIQRRELIKNLAAAPIFGGLVLSASIKNGWLSHEEKNLEGYDGVTSATIKKFDFSVLADLKEKLPSSKAIEGLEMSRLILGGNLIGGWAHARELIYVSKLVKAYHTEDKIYSTFKIAEECGINTFLTNPILSRNINDYWKRGIGKIKFISDCGYEDLMEGIKKSVDNGASACYIHGGSADSLVREGKVDQIQEALEFIKQNGLPGGIGAHCLETVKACVDYGLEPDFWMKTLHLKSYLNVHSELDETKIVKNEEVMYKNVFCENVDETVSYMEGLKQPWIAFKILAAGAIEPKEGFKFAFESGADFICVGMYDFQVVDNANIAHDILNSDFKLNRKRPWLV